MLPLDNIVEVNVNVSTAVASNGVFDVGLFMIPMDNGTVTDSMRAQFFTSAEAADYWLENHVGVEDMSAYTRAVSQIRYYFGAIPAPGRVGVSCYPASETIDVAFEKTLKATNEFYGVYICKSGFAGDDEIALASYIQTNHLRKMLFSRPCSFDQTNESHEPATTFYNAGYMHVISMVSAMAGNGAALMGLAMGMERTHSNSAFSLCYKDLHGMYPDSYSETACTNIEALNSNVYIYRGRTSMLEKGVTASGMRYDEVLYIDEIVDAIQTAMLNMLIDSGRKLPQTDSTTSLFISECNRILEGFHNRGILETAPWRNNLVRNVERGDIIENGYLCMADSFDTQSDEDRAARKGMPITILLCLSGSVESIQITLNIQQ